MELDGIIGCIHTTLTSARERHQQLQVQHTQLAQRCSNSLAALDAILSVSNLIPAAPVATSGAAGIPSGVPFMTDSYSWCTEHHDNIVAACSRQETTATLAWWVSLRIISVRSDSDGLQNRFTSPTL